MNHNLFWILEKRDSDRFPYRLKIEDQGKPILALLVQDVWPGAGSHIFCIRAEKDDEVLELIEKIPIISLRRYGRKISVVLDRPQRKRCHFIFLKKRYKTKSGEYEQIFWMTQSTLRARRPKVLLSAKGDESFEIVVAANERYPWKFPNCTIKRRSLPAGDYALIIDDKIEAIVERKTFDNMLENLSRLQILHQLLGELETFPYSALVIEAAYYDFLSRKRLKYFNPQFSAKAIAEISAFHPKLNVVFAGNKKLANEWTMRFFAAVRYHEKDYPAVVREIMESYPGDGDFYGQEYEVIDKLVQLGQGTIEALHQELPYLPISRLRNILRRLRKDGRVAVTRYGKCSFWQAIAQR